MLKTIWIEAWLRKSPYRTRRGASVYVDLVEAASKAFGTFDGEAHVENRAVVEPPAFSQYRLQDADRLSALQSAVVRIHDVLGHFAVLTLLHAEQEATANCRSLKAQIDLKGWDGRRAGEALQDVTSTFTRAIGTQLSELGSAEVAAWAGKLVTARSQRGYNYEALKSKRLLSFEKGEPLLRSRLACIKGIVDALAVSRNWTAAQPSSERSGKARAQQLPTHGDLERLARDLRGMTSVCMSWQLPQEILSEALFKNRTMLLSLLDGAQDPLSIVSARSALADRLSGAAALIEDLCAATTCFMADAEASKASVAEHGAYLRAASESELPLPGEVAGPKLPRILLDAVNRPRPEQDFNAVALTVLTLYLQPNLQFNECIRDNDAAKSALERFKAVYEAARRYCEGVGIIDAAPQHFVSRMWLLADLFAAAAASSPEPVRQGRLEIARALLGMVVCRKSGAYESDASESGESHVRRVGYIAALQYREVVVSDDGQTEVANLLDMIRTTLGWPVGTAANGKQVSASSRYVLTNEWEIHAQYGKGVNPTRDDQAPGNSSYPPRKALALIGLPPVPPGRFRKGAKRDNTPPESAGVRHAGGSDLS